MGEKRKREGGEVKVKSVGKERIAAVSFGAINPSDDAEFSVYRAKTDSRTLVHGENTVFEYEGETEADQSKYCVAVYDPESTSVELYPADLVSMSSIVKAKKGSSGPAVRQANVRNALQRSALGEEFGTKKAKKAITDMERNRIEADKLEDLETAIVDVVKTSTESLPSQEERKATLSQDRPIPPHNLETHQVDEVYPVEGIIPSREYAVIRVGPVVKEKTAKGRQALLPHKTSEVIAKRLVNLENGVGDQTEIIKLIYYASLLLAVYENKRVNNKAALLAKVGNPPEILISGILDRFAVSKAGHFGKTKDRNFAIDPVHENKLLCYLLALLLRIDNYMLEVAPLAKELSLKPSKLAELFKAMGCSVKNATVAQSEAFGIPRSQAANYKIATLSAPLKLPEVAKRKRQGGR
ncbi:DNA-directed RNA polymerase I subunit Rpa49p [Trichomonascus vanleenenianus]|uniref:DNA-directed RNA polymerase I subunit RPA49 n=1 Tax=Trichomonascus vanleenenianus TaxID=2268995 RepID=UPI003ECB4A52